MNALKQPQGTALWQGMMGVTVAFNQGFLRLVALMQTVERSRTALRDAEQELSFDERLQLTGRIRYR